MNDCSICVAIVPIRCAFNVHQICAFVFTKTTIHFSRNAAQIKYRPRNLCMRALVSPPLFTVLYLPYLYAVCKPDRHLPGKELVFSHSLCFASFYVTAYLQYDLMYLCLQNTLIEKRKTCHTDTVQFNTAVITTIKYETYYNIRGKNIHEIAYLSDYSKCKYLYL